MRPSSIAGILVFSIVTICATSRASDKAILEAKAMRVAEEKLREFVPTLSLLEDRFSEDSQMLFGLATVYSHYSPSPEYSKRCVLLYRKAMYLEPSNKAIRVGMIKRIVDDYRSRRGQLLLALELKREYAMRENLREVEINIPWGDELYKLLNDLLREGDQEKVVIRDFNEARLRLCENFDRRNLPPVITELEKAEEFEPGNAVYNYLWAQLYFDLDRNDEGLEKLIKGSRKAYFNTYIAETASARESVLREGDFPEGYRRILRENLPLPWGVPAQNKVFEIASQKEERRNMEEAIEIYEALVRVSSQYKEEPIPGIAGHLPGKQQNRELLLPFEIIARERLDKIRPKPGIQKSKE